MGKKKKKAAGRNVRGRGELCTTCPSPIHIAAVVMVFFRLPEGKLFLGTIDMVAPVSNTPRYSRPPSQIRTQKTKSRAPPERPRQNSAGEVTSNPLFRILRAILMKRLLFLALPSSPLSCSRLAPCSRRACVCERVVGPDCPPEGSKFLPGLRLGLPPFLSGFLLSLSGWRLVPPPRPPWFLSCPLPRPFDLPLPASLSLPLPPPLPEPLPGSSPLSFADRHSSS